MPNHDTNPRFEGFSNPNFTPVPDEVFDLLAHQLTDIEFRVLLYIVRRTFGFKKAADDISLKQLVEGIRGRDGHVVDRGAGVSKPSAIKAVRGLVEKGVISAVRNRSVEKGDEPTTYSLRFKTEPVSMAFTRGGIADLHGGVSGVDPQDTVTQDTDLRNSNIRNVSRDNFSDGSQDGRGKTGNPGQPGKEFASPSQASLATPSRPRLTKPEELARRAGEPMPIGETLKRRRQPAGSSEDREVIVSYLSDFAREMNDQAPLRVSVTRALNLLARSGLPREAFLQRLYEARSLTKEYSASIQTTVKRNGSPVPVKAKMAYFFAVLEDLLGFKEESSISPPS